MRNSGASCVEFCRVGLGSDRRSRAALAGRRRQPGSLIPAIQQAERECGSCGCELDPLYHQGAGAPLERLVGLCAAGGFGKPGKDVVCIRWARRDRRDACAHVCCARSERMAAALLSWGGVSFRGLKRYALSLTAAEGAVVRRYFCVCSSSSGAVTAQIRTLVGGRARRLGRAISWSCRRRHAAGAAGRSWGCCDGGALFGVRTVRRRGAVQAVPAAARAFCAARS